MPPTATGGLNGSALLACLSRLKAAGQAAGRPAPRPAPAGAFADRLGQWLAWTDAVALAGMLDGTPTTQAPAAALPLDPARRARAQAEVQQLRGSLTRDILADECLAPARPQAPSPRLAPARAGQPQPHGAARLGHGPGHAGALPAWAAADAPLAFAPFRHAHLARQQSMDTAIQALRERLRALLASLSPELARLAAVDAVMQRALQPQVQRLLGLVPAQLEAHFQALQAAAGAAPEAGLATAAPASSAHAASAAATAAEMPPHPAPRPAPRAAPGAPVPPAWLTHYCQDHQALLLAELDFRLQPLLALLEALPAGCAPEGTGPAAPIPS